MRIFGTVKTVPYGGAVISKMGDRKGRPYGNRDDIHKKENGSPRLLRRLAMTDQCHSERSEESVSSTKPVGDYPSSTIFDGPPSSSEEVTVLRKNENRRPAKAADL